ncbi:hypothetical protein HZ326_22476 [Fusarium oxysporum f. sp. albedinis]|nr:hypothetical protein HZ326_22476 [Fusarium oxysporum f. sp. albedinis]
MMCPSCLRRKGNPRLSLEVLPSGDSGKVKVGCGKFMEVGLGSHSLQYTVDRLCCRRTTVSRINSLYSFSSQSIFMPGFRSSAPFILQLMQGGLWILTPRPKLRDRNSAPHVQLR